jgi:GT2 family glycosyltransferase
MQKIESSIIIPVFNNWDLTRNCLKAIATTTIDKSVEVIVVDNASSDATPNVCPLLGRQLFGESFHYQRNFNNLNFGPASNIGAKLATGEFLIFLNNDTIPLPGWYQPLIDDFTNYPDIAATGPVLLYPKEKPFGYTVQHLGIYISPTLSVDHLYKHISADCALVNKRRFFQAITAACMVLRRSSFLDIGMFDEHYVNGFEDLEICAMFSKKGYRMTVNPMSRVIHKESQTLGRFDHVKENLKYFASHGMKHLVPDWHRYITDDGMYLRLGEWLDLQASLPVEHCLRLDKIAEKTNGDAILEILLTNPFWENGWRQLSLKAKADGDCSRYRLVLNRLWADIYQSPEAVFALYNTAKELRDTELANVAINKLRGFCAPFKRYVHRCAKERLLCSRFATIDISEQYSFWLEKKVSFENGSYIRFIRKFWELVKAFPHSYFETWAYELWRQNVDLPRREKLFQDLKINEDIAFSILMPVYNPKPEHLTAAIESVLAQEYPHWELCIADDASTIDEVKFILKKYAELDSRIRIAWRHVNGHIAAATNTALEMAHNPYVALVDQDDILTVDALRIVAGYISAYPEGLLFFSDEDKIDDEENIFLPYFKNDKWDWELLCGQNFVSHLGVYRTDRIRKIGGFRDGFPSSQDYDMLLRYCTGIDAAYIFHIPYVLYHWRFHEGSTAKNINVKSESLDSARRAVQAYLDNVAPGAIVSLLPQSIFLRVKYPSPEVLPLVTLVCNITEHNAQISDYVNTLTKMTSYEEYELLVLSDDDCGQSYLELRNIANSFANVRFMPYAKCLNQSNILQIGAKNADGQIVGFLQYGALPLNNNWLEEIVSCLCRDGVGSVAGKLIFRNNTLAHCGYLVDATGQLSTTLRGASSFVSSNFAWNLLARTVDAFDGMCLFTRKETLNLLGGFDSSLPDSAVADYCLRLGEIGLRSVWWPFAEIFLPVELNRNIDLAKICANDKEFLRRWHGRLVPFNANLKGSGKFFTLYTR